MKFVVRAPSLVTELFAAAWQKEKVESVFIQLVSPDGDLTPIFTKSEWQSRAAEIPEKSFVLLVSNLTGSLRPESVKWGPAGGYAHGRR